ncbi:MAG: hypothetical protein ACK5RQ_00070 [Bacteroidota bacterium]
MSTFLCKILQQRCKNGLQPLRGSSFVSMEQDFSEQENSLWSLANGLWLDYRNGSEYLTKD